MSIGAVKGFEIGSGFKAAQMKGSEQNDPFYYDRINQRFRTKTNNAGGTLGGISNGEDLVMRIAVKPPSSIAKKMETVDRDGNPVVFGTEGRHDPCICPRIVPVAEAMVALVLLDHLLLQDRISKENNLDELRRKMDTIDQQILLLLAQRFDYIGKIAEEKKRMGLDVSDHNREKTVKKNWTASAKTLDLDPEMSKNLVDLILKHSKKKQQEVLQ